MGIFFSLPAFSWDPAELPPGIEVETPGYPVELDGKKLFHARISARLFKAQQRAQVINERIQKLAQDPLFRPESITVKDTEYGSEIMAGDQVIMPIYDFLAKVEGRSAEELAQDYADRIRRAIAAYQKEHSLENLLIRIAKTLVALFILIILVMLVNRGIRRLNQAILVSHRVRAVKIGELEFFTADRMRTVIISVIRGFRFLIILILLYTYFHLGLSFFPATQIYALKLYNSLLGAIGGMGEAIWDQTPSLAFLVVLIYLTRYILKTLRFFFGQLAAGKVKVAGLDAEVAGITYRILRLLIIAFALVVAYPYIPGSESPAFKGISIFLGLLFSLGSSTAIANLIAGISLIYQRSFHEGDVIKVGDATGVVLERRTYITRLKTFRNQIVTIPNSSIIASHITNLSQQVKEGDGLIINTSITIGYDVPWETVHALLIEAARATKDILPKPDPFVLQTALNDFYVTYELNAYTDTPERIPWIYGEMHQHIQDKFNEAGVEIMSPHYTQVRDGNQTTIPADYLPSDYEAPAIRILNTQKQKED
jgi:small-conductance mechanosensitive channel